MPSPGLLSASSAPPIPVLPGPPPCFKARNSRKSVVLESSRFLTNHNASLLVY